MVIIIIAIDILDNGFRPIDVGKQGVVETFVNIGMTELELVQPIDDFRVVYTGGNIFFRIHSVSGIQVLVPIGGHLSSKMLFEIGFNV